MGHWANRLKPVQSYEKSTWLMCWKTLTEKSTDVTLLSLSLNTFNTIILVILSITLNKDFPAENYYTV